MRVRGAVRAAHCEGIKKREGSAPMLAYHQRLLLKVLLLESEVLLLMDLKLLELLELVDARPDASTAPISSLLPTALRSTSQRHVAPSTHGR